MRVIVSEKAKKRKKDKVKLRHYWGIIYPSDYVDDMTDDGDGDGGDGGDGGSGE